MATYREQREDYANLEPALIDGQPWNGRNALSSYQGRSAIYHSASWADAEALEPRAPRQTQTYSPELRAKLDAALRLGVPYGVIAKDFGLRTSTVRDRARTIGIDRRNLVGR